ncbi:hypothetical protein DBV15_12890 [Temnothorax longispinosus]|uniref:Uncharacterized protein n=1 Tax=Temnothorax longispinosus TaxID=300112 RepID=A0A4S2KZK6_9HYME|nr:hypothetical protein DBV15_12890 [Temnothorax longispinosus]
MKPARLDFVQRSTEKVHSTTNKPIFLTVILCGPSISSITSTTDCGSVLESDIQGISHIGDPDVILEKEIAEFHRQPMGGYRTASREEPGRLRQQKQGELGQVLAITSVSSSFRRYYRKQAPARSTARGTRQHVHTTPLQRTSPRRQVAINEHRDAASPLGQPPRTRRGHPAPEDCTAAENVATQPRGHPPRTRRIETVASAGPAAVGAHEDIVIGGQGFIVFKGRGTTGKFGSGTVEKHSFGALRAPPLRFRIFVFSCVRACLCKSAHVRCCSCNDIVRAFKSIKQQNAA